MKYVKKLNLWSVFALSIVLLSGMACSSDDPEITNEEEVITTVNLTFTNNGQTDEVIMASFSDVDGPGGEDPSINGATLNALASYTLEVAFVNEAVSPSEDITAEVRAEDLEHQVFYSFGGNIGIIYTYGDQDSQGNPIGLTGTLTTTDAGNATLTLVLVHKPNKSNSGVANGNLGNAGGEEDIRIQIPITVQ